MSVKIGKSKSYNDPWGVAPTTQDQAQGADYLNNSPGSKRTRQNVTDYMSDVKKNVMPWENLFGLGIPGLINGLMGHGSSAPVHKAAPLPKAPAPAQAPAPTPTPPPSLADYLAEASKMLPPPSFAGALDFGKLAQQDVNQTNDVASRIQAMYNALSGDYKADAPTINAQYNQGINDVGAAQNAATGDVNNAYADARQAQSAQLAALGIGNAAGVIADKGTDAGGDQAAAIANLIQNGTAVKNQLTQGRTSALDYNTKVAQAAPQEGADKSAALQRQLQSDLAQLQQSQAQQSTSMASAQNDYFNNLLQYAQAMGGFDQKNTAADNSNEINAQKLALQQAIAGSKSKSSASSSRAALVASLVKSGEDYATAVANANKLFS